MSHFLVMVIGDNWEEQLAPFEEGSTFFETEDGSRAKWDSYLMGGRWTGRLRIKSGPNGSNGGVIGKPGLMTEPAPKGTADQARVEDIDWATSDWMPFAVLKDGVWSQRGEMGWFGISTDDVPKEAWEAELRSAIPKLPGQTLITMVDCHI